MKKINIEQVRQSFDKNQIIGLGPIELTAYEEMLKRLVGGQKLTFINIICPGYKRRREGGVEEFDFRELSDNVLKCPNVLLMLKKAEMFVKNIDRKLRKKIELKTILADVAILNYKRLSESQNVKAVMNKFFLSIKNFGPKLLKMSELPCEFRNIPLGGIKPKSARLFFAKAEGDIKDGAKEYVGFLVFERVNMLLSQGKSANKKKLAIQAQKEVERFVVEYGLAGLGIRKIYENPIVLFTEPSGYMRGYFYNSFLKKDERLPVLYLC